MTLEPPRALPPKRGEKKIWFRAEPMHGTLYHFVAHPYGEPHYHYTLRLSVEPDIDGIRPFFAVRKETHPEVVARKPGLEGYQELKQNLETGRHTVFSAGHFLDPDNPQSAKTAHEIIMHFEEDPIPMAAYIHKNLHLFDLESGHTPQEQAVWKQLLDKLEQQYRIQH